jgi:hypothetical protein
VKLFISKYALTRGIVEIEDDLPNDDFLRVKLPGAANAAIFSSKDWHTTLQAAKEAAEKQRVAKIAALKRQLNWLQELQF